MTSSESAPAKSDPVLPATSATLVAGALRAEFGDLLVKGARDGRLEKAFENTLSKRVKFEVKEMESPRRASEVICRFIFADVSRRCITKAVCRFVFVKAAFDVRLQEPASGSGAPVVVGVSGTEDGQGDAVVPSIAEVRANALKANARGLLTSAAGDGRLQVVLQAKAARNGPDTPVVEASAQDAAEGAASPRTADASGKVLKANARALLTSAAGDGRLQGALQAKAARSRATMPVAEAGDQDTPEGLTACGASASGSDLKANARSLLTKAAGDGRLQETLQARAARGCAPTFAAEPSSAQAETRGARAATEAKPKTEEEHKAAVAAAEAALEAEHKAVEEERMAAEAEPKAAEEDEDDFINLDELRDAAFETLSAEAAASRSGTRPGSREKDELEDQGEAVDPEAEDDAVDLEGLRELAVEAISIRASIAISRTDIREDPMTGAREPACANANAAALKANARGLLTAAAGDGRLQGVLQAKAARGRATDPVAEVEAAQEPVTSLDVARDDACRLLFNAYSTGNLSAAFEAALAAERGEEDIAAPPAPEQAPRPAEPSPAAEAPQAEEPRPAEAPQAEEPRSKEAPKEDTAAMPSLEQAPRPAEPSPAAEAPQAEELADLRKQTREALFAGIESGTLFDVFETSGSKPASQTQPADAIGLPTEPPEVAPDSVGASSRALKANARGLLTKAAGDGRLQEVLELKAARSRESGESGEEVKYEEIADLRKQTREALFSGIESGSLFDVFEQAQPQAAQTTADASALKANARGLLTKAAGDGRLVGVLQEKAARSRALEFADDENNGGRQSRQYSDFGDEPEAVNANSSPLSQVTADPVRESASDEAPTTADANALKANARGLLTKAAGDGRLVGVLQEKAARSRALEPANEEAPTTADASALKANARGLLTEAAADGRLLGVLQERDSRARSRELEPANEEAPTTANASDLKANARGLLTEAAADGRLLGVLQEKAARSRELEPASEEAPTTANASDSKATARGLLTEAASDGRLLVVLQEKAARNRELEPANKEAPTTADASALKANARGLLTKAAGDGRLVGVLQEKAARSHALESVSDEAPTTADASALKANARGLLTKAAGDGRLLGVLEEKAARSHALEPANEEAPTTADVSALKANARGLLTRAAGDGRLLGVLQEKAARGRALGPADDENNAGCQPPQYSNFGDEPEAVNATSNPLSQVTAEPMRELKANARSLLTTAAGDGRLQGVLQEKAARNRAAPEQIMNLHMGEEEETLVALRELACDILSDAHGDGSLEEALGQSFSGGGDERVLQPSVSEAVVAAPVSEEALDTEALRDLASAILDDAVSNGDLESVLHNLSQERYEEELELLRDIALLLLTDAHFDGSLEQVLAEVTQSNGAGEGEAAGNDAELSVEDQDWVSQVLGGIVLEAASAPGRETAPLGPSRPCTSLASSVASLPEGEQAKLSLSTGTVGSSLRRMRTGSIARKLGWSEECLPSTGEEVNKTPWRGDGDICIGMLPSPSSSVSTGSSVGAECIPRKPQALRSIPAVGLRLSPCDSEERRRLGSAARRERSKVPGLDMSTVQLGDSETSTEEEDGYITGAYEDDRGASMAAVAMGEAALESRGPVSPVPQLDIASMMGAAPPAAEKSCPPGDVVVKRLPSQPGAWAPLPPLADSASGVALPEPPVTALAADLAVNQFRPPGRKNPMGVGELDRLDYWKGTAPPRRITVGDGDPFVAKGGDGLPAVRDLGFKSIDRNRPGSASPAHAGSPLQRVASTPEVSAASVTQSSGAGGLLPSTLAGRQTPLCLSMSVQTLGKATSSSGGGSLSSPTNHPYSAASMAKVYNSKVKLPPVKPGRRAPADNWLRSPQGTTSPNGTVVAHVHAHFHHHYHVFPRSPQGTQD